MTVPFGSAYAEAYDSFYEGKDYAGECARIVQLAAAGGVEPPGRLVDYGCGTGGHALFLAQQGWQVTGVDRSPGMLEAARHKADNQGLKVDFVEGELGAVALAPNFDLAIMMFAVLGYQKTNADVSRALANVRRHLRPGGLFIFDVWHGPAVLSDRPGRRTKVIPLEDGEIIREADGSLDVRHNLCTVTYDLTVSRRGQAPSRAHERHEMRYFFPLELEMFLEHAGFKILRITDFQEIGRDPGVDDWNMLVVAAAV